MTNGNAGASGDRNASARLTVVCTPIGNLADMSPRAADALKRASIVLCEDTRHSRPLLDKVGSHARALSCHAHNESERAAEVIATLKRGEHVALISDAGAPAVSDPGGKLVADVVAAGLDVEVVPGPSALTAALMGAGLDVSRFSFLGFLPRKGGGREELLDAAARSGFGVVLYEAPNRTEETLADLAEKLGERRVVVARELTKVHETFHRGVLASGTRKIELVPPLVERGELVIVVEAGEAKSGEDVDVDAILRDTSLPPKERAKRVAKALGISVKDAYDRVKRVSEGPDAKVARARDLVAAAAKALVEAGGEDDARRRQSAGPGADARVSSEIPGADELMAFLARPTTSLRAPVEAHDAARALLAALAALDALGDALEFERDGRDGDRTEK